MEDEEKTSPGIDPAVMAAMESLRRVQAATNQHVSDITDLLVKKSLIPPDDKS